MKASQTGNEVINMSAAMQKVHRNWNIMLRADTQSVMSTEIQWN